MATKELSGVVPGDESEIHDEPHLQGSRITVRLLQRRVEERGDRPADVAERHGLDLADVYAALSYYHSHPDEMRRVEARRDELAEVAETATTLTPPDS